MKYSIKTRTINVYTGKKVVIYVTIALSYTTCRERRDNDDGDEERRCRNMIEPVSLYFLFSFFFSFFVPCSSDREETHTKKKCPPLSSLFLYERLCFMLTIDYDE